MSPARLREEPAVLEGTCGLGKVVLSLVHFDTPGDRGGAIVLKNLWDYLTPGWPSDVRPREARDPESPLADVPPDLRNAMKDILVQYQILETQDQEIPSGIVGIRFSSSGVAG